MSKFHWKKYCFDNNLPSFFNEKDALYHYINEISKCSNSNAHVKVEPFSLNFNYNKNIVIFCHTLPTPDKDSGSNRLYEIIKILIQLQYNIYYITHTTLDDSPQYKQALLDLGVKDIYCIDHKKEIYCDKIFANLVKNQHINFDIAIFYFYDMFHLYSQKIKQICPTIKTIIDSVDVHWLRLERGNRLLSKDKEQEKISYDSADVVFAVTDNDKESILQECPSANVKILSNIHHFYDINPKYKKNLLFIGGSNHTPNIDAALYAIKIFQQFIKTYPEYNCSKLFLVGTIFDNQIIELANSCSNIVILGHLNKEQLSELYKTELIGSLAPITWGAGIKGKICEAISHNIPVITTDVGNEGINLKHGKSGFIAKDQNEFIESIYRLFNLKLSQVKKISQAAKDAVKLLISQESAHDVLFGTILCKHIVLSIATYNNSLITERCINSIMANTIYPNFSIHVTSNGCSDNTRNILENLQQIYGKNKLKITLNDINKHFIEAHNHVINKYPDSDIVLINNDMEFIDRSWLNHLYSAAYSAGYIGCAGGKLLDYKMNISESGAYIFNDGSGINLGRGCHRDDISFNKSKYVGYVSGCLMYMKRTLINKFGSLDTRYYPCYYEDSDWQYNLHLHGYKTIINPKCEALHMEGASSNKISDFKKQCMENNKKKFLNKFNNIKIEELHP